MMNNAQDTTSKSAAAEKKNINVEIKDPETHADLVCLVEILKPHGAEKGNLSDVVRGAIIDLSAKHREAIDHMKAKAREEGAAR